MFDDKLAKQLIDWRLDGYADVEIALMTNNSRHSVMGWFKQLKNEGYNIPPRNTKRKYPYGHEYR